MNLVQFKRRRITHQKRLLLLGTLTCTIQGRQRQFKVRPIRRNRRIDGEYNRYFVAKLKNDPVEFANYTRLNMETFNLLLELLKPHYRISSLCEINLEQRLVITLRFLGTGESYQDLKHHFQVCFLFKFVGASTVHRIVLTVCQAIWTALQPQYLSPPKTEGEWRHIAARYYEQLQFPNCIGSIDGKHIMLKQPYRSGTMYFNYKGHFSIVLLAVCCSDYIIRLLDCGAYGKQSDGGVYSSSYISTALESETNPLNIPPAQQLPSDPTGQLDGGINQPAPFVIVGDPAFPLTERNMRNYCAGEMVGDVRNDEKLRFNYRHNRARGRIENVFGIMSQVWRCLLAPLDVQPQNADTVVKAICVLHNFRQIHMGVVSKTIDGTSELQPVPVAPRPPPDGELPTRPSANRERALNDLEKVGGRPRSAALRVRELFRQFVNSDYGKSVCPWQDKYALRGRLYE